MEAGYALTTVLAFSTVVFATTLLSLNRMLTAQHGSIRQSYAEDAKEIAESGISTTLESLNSDHPYLLINQYSDSNYEQSGNWGNPSFPSSRCPDTASTGHPDISQTSNLPKGRYRIESFRFEGTQFYGGTGYLKVTGERLGKSNEQLLASATIETSFDIKPKNCNTAFGKPATSSGFPGLLGWSINLGGNDVLGKISGNVLCIDCQDLSQFGANNNSVVGGEKFMGFINVPPVPTLPISVSSSITQQAITAPRTITAGQSNGGMCAQDPNIETLLGEVITHCSISSIDLKGKGLLVVDTTHGPVRLYISGDVNLGGQAGISQIQTGVSEPQAGRLSLFGNSRDNSSSTHQTVMLSGVSKPQPKAANLFAFFPDGTVGINGGAQGTAECDETEECGGGDIRGAVWAQEWNGSNSNNAQLVVPPDMGDQLWNHIGMDYAIGVRDYVALGNNSWANRTQQ